MKEFTALIAVMLDNTADQKSRGLRPRGRRALAVEACRETPRPGREGRPAALSQRPLQAPALLSYPQRPPRQSPPRAIPRAFLGPLAACGGLPTTLPPAPRREPGRGEAGPGSCQGVSWQERSLACVAGRSVARGRFRRPPAQTARRRRPSASRADPPPSLSPVRQPGTQCSVTTQQ